MHDLTALWQIWGQSLVFAVPVCLLLAAAALPFMSVTSLCLAAASKRGLHDRCGRQTAGLALLLQWMLVAGAAGLFLVCRLRAAAPSPFFAAFTLLAGELLLAAALLATVMARAWKTLRPHPVLLGLFGVLSGLCVLAVPALLAAGRSLMSGGVPGDLTGWQHLFPLMEAGRALAGEPLFLPLLAALFLGEAAAGGGLALLWLVLRRAVDDYGRDYYVFAARWCARWAAVGGWGGLAAATATIWLATDGAFAFPSTSRAPALLGGLFAPLALASVMWTIIGASVTPMRHKAGMVLAVFCLLAALAGGAALGAQLG